MVLLRPLRVLFGIYAVLIFAVTMILAGIFIVLVFNLAPKKAPQLAHAGNRIWAQTLLVCFFIRAKVRNRYLIDPKKTYIFISNHQSQLDIPIFARSCSNTFRFLAKAELTKIPLLGYVIKKMYITVDRKDRKDRNRSIEVMKASLDAHISVFLCPEGTRNREDEPPLLDFRDGAFRLAVLTQTPIAVLVLYNSGRLLHPKRPVELSPGFIDAEWLRVIDTTGMTMDEVPALKDQVYAEMTEAIRTWRAKHKPA